MLLPGKGKGKPLKGERKVRPLKTSSGKENTRGGPWAALASWWARCQAEEARKEVRKDVLRSNEQLDEVRSLFACTRQASFLPLSLRILQATRRRTEEGKPKEVAYFEQGAGGEASLVLKGPGSSLQVKEKQDLFGLLSVAATVDFIEVLEAIACQDRPTVVLWAETSCPLPYLWTQEATSMVSGLSSLTGGSRECFFRPESLARLHLASGVKIVWEAQATA